MAFSPSSTSCTISSPFSHTIPMVIPSTLTPLKIRLYRTNYGFWKSQIIPVVRVYDLEGILLDTRIIPKEFITNPANPCSVQNNPEYASWIRLDQFLMSWFLSSMPERMLGHVVYCKSSTKVWTVLDQLFSTELRPGSACLCTIYASSWCINCI